MPVLPHGSTRMPSGPIAPATNGAVAVRRRVERAESRAIRAPSRLMVAHLLAQSEGAQLDAIGAERVGLDDVGAGAEVFAVHAAHQIGVGEVQRLEAAIDEDALRVQLRAHRAVAHQHALFDGFEKSADHVTHRSRADGASHANVSASTSRYDRFTRSTQTVGMPTRRTSACT